MGNVKSLIKELLKNYPTIEEQLELNLFDLEVLKEYYVKENKRDIAAKFDDAKKRLLKF